MWLFGKILVTSSILACEKVSVKTTPQMIVISVAHIYEKTVDAPTCGRDSSLNRQVTNRIVSARGLWRTQKAWKDRFRWCIINTQIPLQSKFAESR
jgi:hypothetical protein